MPDIALPYEYEPRPYQVGLLRAMDSGYQRAVAIWHRRAGKDKTLINLVAKKAFERTGTYYYLFPTYAQGKKIIWDGMDRAGFAFRRHIPRELVKAENATEQKITLANDSIIQVIGTDNVDSIMGTNPIGCVFSEYALQAPIAWDLVRPILRENGGWAVFNYTPRGRNHGHALYKMARKNPDWYCERLTVNDTGAISAEDVQAERDAGMPEDLIQQEFYCSFDAAIQGAYYGDQIRQARDQGRIGNVPYQPEVPVHTAWDIGIGDATAIWFFQLVGREVHLIDYYEAVGKGLDHYARYMQSLPYIYGEHWAPHDIRAREWGTGRSRVEMAASLGIRFNIQPQLSVDDGIQSGRALFPRVWIDETKCERGIDALTSYCKEWDEKKNDFKNKPLHDWASHSADSYRGLAVSVRDRLIPPEPRFERTFNEEFRHHVAQSGSAVDRI